MHGISNCMIYQISVYISLLMKVAMKMGHGKSKPGKSRVYCNCTDLWVSMDIGQVRTE